MAMFHRKAAVDKIKLFPKLHKVYSSISRQAMLVKGLLETNKYVL